MILTIIFSGDGINATEEDTEREHMTSKSKPPGRVKIP